jgi:predicted tellurium resistance membrane protein TerC
MMGLTAPLTVVGTNISGRDLILIVGGSSSRKKYHGDHSSRVRSPFFRRPPLAALIVQIMLLDIVFPDSIISNRHGCDRAVTAVSWRLVS